jgi:tRNA-dihydrouridine synthase
VSAGESEKKINAPRVVALLQQAGAAAVTIHGRTMEQR